jgi:arylsulfatase A-like enzyme/tetratricopeptide (TPR) repeat protein
MSRIDPLKALLAILLASCSNDAGTSSGSTASDSGQISSGKTNLLIVTLDTTRADRLGYAAYDAARTPNLDSLALESAVFSNARTHVPLTLPSHSSLMTGLLPTSHGIHVNMQGAIPGDVRTLAQSFQAAEYATGASVAAWVLADRFGISRGFDTYNDVNEDLEDVTALAERPGGEITEETLAWLEANGEQPFFYWAHYFDAHDPYRPPTGFQDFEDPYDGELSFVDHQVGKILSWLEENGKKDNTLVIVVGDHGEDLDQHGEGSHGLLIYDGTLRIPLLMSMPGRITPQILDDSVGLIDIAPTVCELLDLSGPGEMDGRSVVPAIDGEDMGDAPFFAEGEYSRRSFSWSRLRSFVMGDWKLIDSPNPELFNLSVDYGETNNLAGAEPERVEAMREAMRSYLASKTVRDAVALNASGEADAALAALGYVAGKSGSIDDDPDDLKEPRDMVAIFKGMIRADSMLKRKEAKEALPLIQWMVEQSPESSEIYGLLGNCHFQLKQYERSRVNYELALEGKADNPHHLTRLGNCYKKQRNYVKAEECYRAVLALDPQFGAAHSRLGWILATRQEWSEALDHFTRCVELDPNSVNARCNLANALCAMGMPKEGLKELDAGLSIDPNSRPLIRTKISALHSTSREEEALVLAKRALELFPGDKELQAIHDGIVNGPTPVKINSLDEIGTIQEQRQQQRNPR